METQQHKHIQQLSTNTKYPPLLFPSLHCSTIKDNPHTLVPLPNTQHCGLAHAFKWSATLRHTYDIQGAASAHRANGKSNSYCHHNMAMNEWSYILYTECNHFAHIECQPPSPPSSALGRAPPPDHPIP